MPRSLTPCLALIMLISLASAGWAQKTPDGNQPPAAPKTISMEMSDVLLRQALKVLFMNANAEYAISSDIPDTKINLKVVDQPFDIALGIILREGSAKGQRLTYVKEAGIYRIRSVAESAEPALVRLIPLTNARAETLIPQIQALAPEAVILTNQAANGLLVRGSDAILTQVEEAVRMLDVAPITLILKAEVVMVPASKGKGAEGRSILLSTVLRSLSGQEAEGEDQISGSPSQTSRLTLRAKALPVGNGTYEITSRWNVSLPLVASKVGGSGNKESLIRLEKRLTNTMRFVPGQTSVVGGIILSQYGLKNEILFFLTVTEVK